MEKDGIIVGALYTQQIIDADLIYKNNYVQIEDHHNSSGKIFQLLSLRYFTVKYF